MQITAYNINTYNKLQASIGIGTGGVAMVQSAIPSKLILTQYNTQDIAVYGLMDVDTLQFVNDSVNLTATLLDQNRNQVAGCVAVALTYSGGSNGNYIGQIVASGFNPPAGAGYTLVLDGDGEAGAAHFHREVPTVIRVANGV